MPARKGVRFVESIPARWSDAGTTSPASQSTSAPGSPHAQAGEILVSRTVTDLVAGSVFGFIDRGAYELKGIDGPRPLFAVDTR